MRSRYPMARRMAAAARNVSARGLATSGTRGTELLRVSGGRTWHPGRSVGGATQTEERVDPTVLSSDGSFGARVGNPARAVDDERVAMLALAQRQGHGPALRPLVARERRRGHVPAVEVARHRDASCIRRVE